MDTEVIIVGAGLSGLIAANILHSAGKKVIVLDKGRSVGGRLATRRIQNGLADHGAQFFTARTATFQQYVEKWLAADRVSIWSHGWSDGSLKRTYEDGHPRYVATGGMNQLAKYLASSLEDIRTNYTVVSISWTGTYWSVMDENGLTLTSNTLILTPPVPQSLDMLIDIPMTETERADLDRIHYNPCLCGIFAIDGDVNLPAPGGIQDFEKEIYWIADNKAKGISDQHIITVHAGARFSRRYYDVTDELVLDLLLAELQPYLPANATVVEAQLKKWLYSVPITTYPSDYLQLSTVPLFFAGDAFGGRGRVEGAFLSGYEAGNAVLQTLA